MYLHIHGYEVAICNAKMFCLIRHMCSREKKNIKSITAQTKKITKEPAKTDKLNQIYLDR